MVSTTQHEEKEDLKVDIDIPTHDPRVTTELFKNTREKLIARDKSCYICGSETPPLQAHHYPIERCLMDMIDWSLVEIDARNGKLGEAAQGFDWSNFKDPVEFVDNMLVNGLLLCEQHILGKMKVYTIFHIHYGLLKNMVKRVTSLVL